MKQIRQGPENVGLRILILTQYYPPEIGAPQNRLSDLARRLRERGHSITVLTALPNYPSGEVFPEYRGRCIVDEGLDGIRVIRGWIYATRKKDFRRRIMNYCSFMMSSIVWGMSKVGRQDLLVVESPPLLLGVSGLVLSKLKRARLVLNVSDLWPESPIELGFIRNRTVIRLARWLEEFLYARAAMITGQTQGIVDSIRLRFPEKRVELITNGVDVGGFLPAREGGRQLESKIEFGCSGKFVVGYAGLHGLGQGLETVVDAADILREHPDICFVLVGEGPERDRLMEIARRRELANIKFFPPQTTARMPQIYNMFDVAVIPLKRLDLFRGALPSKLFEAMAAALPVIVSIDGEARVLVLRAQAGIAVEPEDARGIANAVLRLYGDEAYRQALGGNGRRYVEENYDRGKIAGRFEELLLQVNGEG